jgi:hypothetical protein
MHIYDTRRVTIARAATCLLLTAALLALSLFPTVRAHGQAEEQDIATGPIDPAAGAWITYKGERTVPGQPEPQLFSLRIAYDFPSSEPRDGKVLDATVTESDAAGKVVSSRTFKLQTIDRLYRSQDTGEEGYWKYWLMPGLDKDGTASIDNVKKLAAEEIQDFDYKGNRFQVARMRGEGVELLVERNTGLVFRIAHDGGETLQIEDTNMLAHYSAWGYCQGYAAAKSRLNALASEHPDLVEVSSLGKSAKGRDICVAHITDFTSKEPKSSVVISAAMEGDAPEGGAFMLDLIEDMVKRAGEDETAAGLLDRLNIYVMPLVNPDGLQRWLAMPDSAESQLLSSQAPRNGNLVNINRNFDIKWEEGNRDPDAAEFAGPSPFSETESQILGKLFEDVPADLYLNLHTGEDLINSPWNWSEQAASNPEWSFYEGVMSELADVFPYPTRVGAPEVPFTGSSTDWAYEGNGASSPVCFDLYMHRPSESEAYEDDGSLLDVYGPFREAIFLLMENLQSYLAVDILAPELRAEVNVPIDAVVKIQVSGKRALPNARVRLILPDEGGLKFSSMAEKEIDVGDLQPGSSVKLTWNLEGKISGSNTAAVVLISSYPEYEHIPGTYGAEMEITISTQRTWLVLVLLSAMVLLVLGMVLLSMRKYHRTSQQGSEE